MRKNKVLQVRLTDEEKEIIEKKAMESGHSVSDYCRITLCADWSHERILLPRDDRSCRALIALLSDPDRAKILDRLEKKMEERNKLKE